jgi:exosortase A-associated hydrolase 2
VTVPQARVSGHFLEESSDRLAVVLWEPAAPARFAALFVPPFGDEMNKSRHMAALQARSFAHAGGTVALLDLRGTGDSGGDHADATWKGWHDDVAAAWQWLRKRVDAPAVLWGMRTGALLAAGVAADTRVAPSLLLLWQPVASGRAFFNQFLRLAGLRERMQGDTAADPKAVRKMLAAGSAVEVAGYQLHPQLVAEAETVELAKLDVSRCPVLVREVLPESTPSVSPFVAGVVTRWQSAGVEIDALAVSGPSFWIAQEIEEAPQLVDATTSAVLRHVCRTA